MNLQPTPPPDGCVGIAALAAAATLGWFILCFFRALP